MRQQGRDLRERLVSRRLVDPVLLGRRSRQRTLLLHGRDDRVIPLDASLRLLGLLPAADLHVFARCGHAVPAERGPELHRLVSLFLENHV